MGDQNSAQIPPASPAPPVGVPPVVEIVPPQAEPQQTPLSSKFSLSPKVMLIILVLLIIAVVGSGLYLSKGSQPNPTPTPTPTIASKPTPTPDPTASWKIYNNTRYGYAFKYPSNYHIAHFPDLKEIKTSGDEEFVQIYKYTEQEAKDSLKGGPEYGEEIYYDYFGVFSDYIVGLCNPYDKMEGVKAENVEVDGLKGIKYTGVPSQFEQIYLYFEKGGGCLYIQFYIDPSNKKGSHELFDQILSTFRFDSP